MTPFLVFLNRADKTYGPTCFIALSAAEFKAKDREDHGTSNEAKHGNNNSTEEYGKNTK